MGSLLRNLTSFRLSALLAALPLAGCGAFTANSVSSATATTLYVTQFSPTTGSYTAMPTTIAIAFSDDDVYAAQATLASNYTMNCAGAGAVQATSVSYSAPWATVTFNSQTVADGSICVLSVNNIGDSDGNYLATTQANYTITSSTGSNAFSWSESGSATNYGLYGGTGGTGFTELGNTGYAMSGFNLDISTKVIGLQGIYTDSTGANIATGVNRGSSPAASSILCPTGMRVTGVFGYYGTYIYSVGVSCANSTKTQTSVVASLGSNSGSYFSMSCASGFVTGIWGAAGTYVDSLGISCQ